MPAPPTRCLNRSTDVAITNGAIINESGIRDYYLINMKADVINVLR